MNEMTSALLPVLRMAGMAIMEVYQEERLFKTEYKADKSPLTEADKQSNAIICEALERLYPDIPIISEENKEAGYETRSKYERFFLVDPLDGTKEFIKRNGEFTINVAYLEGREAVAGFIHVPVSGQTYVGIRFEGAWRIDQDDKVEALQSKSFRLTDTGIKVVASRSHRDPGTNQIISLLNQPEIISVGSALKFIRIAEGEAHFYPRLAPTMEWDTAAAQCIVEEAGGGIIRYDTRLPVTYNKEDLTSPYFIAYGKLLDPERLNAILDS